MWGQAQRRAGAGAGGRLRALVAGCAAVLLAAPSPSSAHTWLFTRGRATMQASLDFPFRQRLTEVWRVACGVIAPRAPRRASKPPPLGPWTQPSAQTARTPLQPEHARCYWLHLAVPAQWSPLLTF